MKEPIQQVSATGRTLPQMWFIVIIIIWSGQAISMFTSYAAGYAAVWYITETTGSAWMLAIASICAFLPQGLLSPFGGIIADKYNRKMVMIFADLSVGVISLILGIAILLGEVSLPLIMVMIVVRSIGQAFHGPAMMAAMPMLVPEKHLLRINTLDQLLMSMAGILGPAFGIFLYTTLGFHVVMFLDFAGAILAVIALMLAKIPTIHDSTTDEQHVFANLKDGWRALSVNRGLIVLIAGLTLGMMAFGPMSALFPLMTLDQFNGDGYMASLTEAVFGAGMLVGSIIIMIWGGGKRLAGLIAVAAVIVGIAVAACGLLTPDMFPAFVVLCGVMAVACAWFNGPLITLVQKNVPEEKMGRALGLTNAAIGLATPIGIGIGGIAAEAIGVSAFFVIDGLIVVVLGVLLYIPKSVRSLDTGDTHGNNLDNGNGGNNGNDSQVVHGATKQISEG